MISSTRVGTTWIGGCGVGSMVASLCQAPCRMLNVCPGVPQTPGYALCDTAAETQPCEQQAVCYRVPLRRPGILTDAQRVRRGAGGTSDMQEARLQLTPRSLPPLRWLFADTIPRLSAPRRPTRSQSTQRPRCRSGSSALSLARPIRVCLMGRGCGLLAPSHSKDLRPQGVELAASVASRLRQPAHACLPARPESRCGQSHGAGGRTTAGVSLDRNPLGPGGFRSGAWRKSFCRMVGGDGGSRIASCPLGDCQCTAWKVMLANGQGSAAIPCSSWVDEAH